MVRLLVILSRSLPLVIALAVLAIAIYFFVSWRHSPTRAKEMLIKVFLVVCSAIAVFFALASIYAILDNNVPVLELAASCAVVGAVGLVITLICRHFFKKHHPHYKKPTNAKATPVSNKPDMLSAITRILNYINDHRQR